MGRIRIIAGHLKGRRIDVPAVAGLRPTPDRVREALFNILGPTLVGARVLDAYSGSGALGLEALSRGAASVVFIEVDPRAARVLAETIRRLAVEEACQVQQGAVAQLLADGRTEPRYDLVLADPPYDGDEARRFLPLAAERLAPGGRIVLEREAVTEPLEVPGLERFRCARYGRARLDFYRSASARPSPEPRDPSLG